MFAVCSRGHGVRAIPRLAAVIFALTAMAAMQRQRANAVALLLFLHVRVIHTLSLSFSSSLLDWFNCSIQWHPVKTVKRWGRFEAGKYISVWMCLPECQWLILWLLAAHKECRILLRPETHNAVWWRMVNQVTNLEVNGWILWPGSRNRSFNCEWEVLRHHHLRFKIVRFSSCSAQNRQFLLIVGLGFPLLLTAL